MSATLLALTVLLLMAAASPRAEAASTASISGKVTDSHGNPITTQDICVSADRTEYYENESDHLTTTDSSGDYTITGLAAGSYEVYFSDCEGSARNDVAQYYDDQTEYESATTIALTEGQARTGVDDSLAAATTISGNVYAGAGTSTPLQGICVDTYSTSGSLDYGVEVKTAADGSYTITHVVPGVRYEVEFYDCNPVREYLTQYYNGVSENGPGTTVTATLASPATGIDAHMEKGASISGTVTDSKGDAIATEDICVSALQPDDEAFYSYGEAKTNSSGQYTIGGLKPGSYDVYFADCYGSARDDSPQYYDQQNSATFAEAVTLKAAQTQTGVDASLEPATTISGHIYAGSGTSTPLEDICVYAYIANNTDTYYSYYGSSAQSGADGSYTLTHIEPNVSYDIEFFECGSGKEYLTQYYDGASDTLQATTITPTTSPLAGIDAHMEKGASISGSVSDAEGKPITTREVCVEADLQGSNESYGYGSATIGAGGEYSITGLPAGSYKVYFYDCGSTRNDLPQYYDGAGTANAASLVVLSAGGAQAGINATMQPATTISGHVYGTSDTSTPLQGICAEALPTNGESELYGEVDTSADGSYTIDHITPSTEYRVYFRDCNDPEVYLSQYYDGASYSSATILTPTVANPAAGVDAHMEKGASISGTVSDAEGKPVTTRDVCVTVDPATYEDSSENDHGSATTDSSGNYTVGGLAPGSYDVEFADCDYDSERNDLPQYYDNQSSYGSAEPVSLTAMQERTGIDASLQPATSISGHVYGSVDTSAPLGGICVEALEGGSDEYVSYTEAAANGSYTLLHLTPSSGYKVYFYECDDASVYESQFYEGASEYSSAKTVTPGTSPTTGIDAHLVKNRLRVTITGGPANGAASDATDASFAFTSEAAGATFECELDGKGFTPCSSPVLASTLNGGAALANGVHTFSVEAIAEGKTGPVKTIYWTIDTSGPTSTSGGSTPAGGTFSSAPGQAPSTSTPVITEVTVPVAAEIALTNEPSTTPSANGYTVFGQQIRIAATDGSGNPITGTAADPIALTFSLDATEVPAGVNLAEITVLRNGSPAGNCTKDGTAEPDPCVSSRTALPGGGVQITVLTTHCSLWNFALTSPSSKSGSGEQTGPPSKETSPSGGGNPGAPGNNPPGSSPSPSGAGAPAGPTAAGGVLGITIGRAATPTRPLSRAQKLAKAIAACRKVKKSKRQQCVAAAKRRYAPSKPKTRKKRKG